MTSIQAPKIKGCSVTFMIVYFALCVIQTSAQPGKAVAVPSDVWHLSYTITIKGSGKIEPEEPEDPTIYWKVDRTYSATFSLANGTVFSPGSDNPLVLKAKRFVRFSAAKLPLVDNMKVKIDDYLILVNEEDICEVVTKRFDKRTWEADVAGAAKGRFDASLIIDNQTRSYNISIPITLTTADSDLRYKRISEESRTPSVGKITHETKVLDEQNYSIFDVVLPRVFGLIENQRVRHNDYIPLNQIDGGYEFTSKEEVVHGKVLPNIDVEDKVKLTVFYRFKK